MKRNDTDSEQTRHLEFQDNTLMPLLFGERDRYLGLLQDLLGASIFAKGNRVAITGTTSAVEMACVVSMVK
ncbi:MAG: hypothetical protein GY915_01420 [bacterium]|nr:hypothetical protein [bacterium]